MYGFFTASLTSVFLFVCGVDGPVSGLAASRTQATLLYHAGSTFITCTVRMQLQHTKVISASSQSVPHMTNRLATLCAHRMFFPQEGRSEGGKIIHVLTI